MALFNKNNAAQVQYSERQLLEGSYKNARNNILLILALTVINIILLVTNANRYFLFSAYIPFCITDWGMYLCGMYPAEYYSVFASPEFLPMGVFVAAMCIVVAILALYVLCWVFSKQKVGWLIFATVFFVVDSVVMLALDYYLDGDIMESLLDYVIHAWVIYSFVNGVLAHKKLKNLPEEELPVFEPTPTETAE